jgi:hypothetical protein
MYDGWRASHDTETQHPSLPPLWLPPERARKQMFLVGFDPGGKDAFGWAVVHATNGQLELIASGNCTGAKQAFQNAAAAIPQNIPDGVGIDAPLFWVYGGDRASDKAVRKMVVAKKKGSSGTVSHVNSLQGACLVEGILVARLVQNEWPTAQVTEAHPKALLLVSSEAKDWVGNLNIPTDPDHAKDAALAAYSAHALVTTKAGWRDLVDREDEVRFFPSGSPTSYYFPTPE